MNDDFESRLSESLKGAVPPPPADVGRARGALRYARRARRTKAAFAVGAVAALVVAGTVVPSLVNSAQSPDSVAGPPRAPLPAPRVQHPFTCSAQPRHLAPPPKGRVPEGAVLARICPAPSRGERWTAPPDPLLTGLNGLADDVNGLWAGPVACAPTQVLAVYTLIFQYADGSTVSVRGRVGGCGEVYAGSRSYLGATTLLERYLALLQAQRASHRPPAAVDMAPRCLPDAHLSDTAVLVDARHPAFRRAIVCGYRDPGPPGAQAAGRLSPEQARQIDADLAAHMTHHRPVDVERACLSLNGPSGTTLISAVDAWGGRVDLTSGCGDFYQFVDDRGTWYWTPSASTSRMLHSVLRPTKLPPEGLLQGRLVEVGGPYPGTPRPISGTVNVRGDDSTHVVNVGRDGRFHVTLVAGRYRVAGSSPLLGAGHPTCGTQHPYVTVRGHETTRVSVVCPIP